MPVRDRTFALHVLLAGALLVLGALWVRPTGQVSIDEGAAALQAEALAEDGTWALTVPLLELDGEGSAAALRSFVRTSDGYAPLARNPLYPAVLGLAARALGLVGTIGVSVAGTLVAAVAGAIIARRLDRRLAIPTLYVLALGSPLAFNSTMLLGHAAAAGAVGVTAAALLRHQDTAAGERRWLVVAALSTAAAVMLRTEAALLAGAAVAVLGAVAIRSRPRRVVAPAATVAIGATVGFVASRLWTKAISAEGEGFAVAQVREGWLSDKLHALRITTIDAGMASDAVRLRLVLACIVLALVAVLLRLGGDRLRLVPPLAAAAAGLAVWWAVSAPTRLTVPGLLLAFPVVWFGMAAGGLTTDGRARILIATCALFAMAVAATQYRQGGGFEWGARYVAIALPLATPVALLGLARTLDRVPRPLVARTAVGSLALVLAALGAVGGTTRRDLAQTSRDFGDALLSAAPLSALGPADHDGRPIVVSEDYLVPQLLWPRYDDARWLHLGADDPLVLERLADAGVDRYTILLSHGGTLEPLLEQVDVLSREELREWTLLVVRPSR